MYQKQENFMNYLDRLFTAQHILAKIVEKSEDQTLEDPAETAILLQLIVEGSTYDKKPMFQPVIEAAITAMGFNPETVKKETAILIEETVETMYKNSVN